jgi:hypothetical protein
MPKAILKFNLPQEQYEFNIAKCGGTYLAMLEEFDQALRSKYKYEEKQETTWEEVRDLWYAHLNDNNIRLFED